MLLWYNLGHKQECLFYTGHVHIKCLNTSGKCGSIMWFQTVDTTVLASLLQCVLSSSHAAAQLISMATSSVQLKINTTQETVLHCNSPSEPVECDLVGGVRRHRWRVSTCIFLTCNLIYVTLHERSITDNVESNFDVHPVLKPQKCCIWNQNMQAKTTARTLHPLSYHGNPTVLNCSFGLACSVSSWSFREKKNPSRATLLCWDHKGLMKNRRASFLRTSPRINFIKKVNQVCATSQRAMPAKRQQRVVSRGLQESPWLLEDRLSSKSPLVVAERRKEKHLPLSWNSLRAFWRPRWMSMTWSFTMSVLIKKEH